MLPHSSLLAVLQLLILLTQLAQKDDPVPEGNLEDKHLNQAAARSLDKTYDKGHIAPHPGLQLQGSADPEDQKKDANYWLMQPVYSHEYTESVRPRHIPTDTVGQGPVNACSITASVQSA